MNDSVLRNDELEWRVVRTSSRRRCEYGNVPGTTVTNVDFTQVEEAPPAGFGYLDDLIDALEADPELTADLAEARREIGAAQLASGRVTLASLRLALGLSQADLAARLGTVQGAISRIEAGSQQPGLATLRRLSAVLGVDMNTLDKALPQ